MAHRKEVRCQILLVDSFPANLYLLTELTEQGYCIQSVTSAEQALLCAQSIFPDLILLDTRVPGVTAYTLYEQLRACTRTRDIPIIFLSQSYEEMDKLKAFDCRAVEYFVKPFQMCEALARIKTHLTLENRQRYQEESNSELIRANEETNYYRLIAKKANDAIIVIDENSVITYVNRVTESLFGYRAHELLGQNITLLMPEHLRSRHKTSFDRYLATGQRQLAWSGIEFTGLHKDGRVLDLEISLGEFDENGNHKFIGIARDISERKKAIAWRDGQNRILEMIATTSNTELADVLSSLASLIESQCEGALCSILLLDAESLRVRHLAAPCLPDAYTHAIDGVQIGPKAGSCGTAMYRKKPVIVADIMQDPLWEDYRELAARFDLRACWSTPIFSAEGNILGSFALYYRSVHHPNTNETRMVEIATHIAGIAIERKQTEARIHYIANHDALTGLANRALQQDRLSQAIAQAHREKNHVALLFIDLDNFKLINDSNGHPMGDRVLQMVAIRLQCCLREGDSVARLGGDEFVITLPLSNSEDAALVAQRALQEMALPFIVDEHELNLGASIGISLYPTDGIDGETLMHAADMAMYHAKEKGRGNYQFFTAALNEAALQRTVLSNQLRQALARSEFIVYYQPQINLQTGRIVSVEALLRWQPPGKDAQLCQEFIAVAEETGLIRPIGEWVLRQACEQLKRLHRIGHPALGMAVNVSARQLNQPDFPALVKGILDETGLAATALELEITETILMQPSEENLAILAQLNNLGVHLSVDDFGQGYASLVYLQRFPIHSLKIDRAFVSGIGLDLNSTAIVTAIIAMANSLHLNIIAEGVECASQADFLKAQGCHQAQGYYYSKPISAEKLTTLLKRDRSLLSRSKQQSH